MWRASIWRALISDEGGLAAGAKVVRRFGKRDRLGCGLSDGFFVDLGEIGRDDRALGRLVGDLGEQCSGRANAVNPGPPTLTRPGGGSLTSRTPNTMVPPGANLATKCLVANRTAAGSK